MWAATLLALASALSGAQQAGIEGVALNSATGQPLTGVHVRLANGGFHTADLGYGAISQRAGRFSIAGVRPGSYILTAELRGFIHVPEEITIEPGRRVLDYKLRLTPGITITGRVVDEHGDPMQGVRVRADAASDTTNERGEFRLLVAPGENLVEVDRAAPLEVTSARDVTGIEIRRESPARDLIGTPEADGAIRDPKPAEERNEPLSPPATVEGAVSNALTGERLIHARVKVWGKVRGVERDHEALTDVEGKFSISGLAPGTYQMTAARAGFVHESFYHPIRDRIELRPGETRSGVRLELTPCGAISGRVLDADGVPIQSIGVSVEGGGYIPGRATDENGRFRFGGLAPGKYRIRARRYEMPVPPEVRSDGTEEVRYAPAVSAEWIQVTAGAEARGIEVRMKRAPIVRVSGTVHGIPEHAQDVTVHLKGVQVRTARVRRDGTFELWRADPGNYRVSASCRLPSEEFRHSPPVDVEVGQSHVDNLALTSYPPADISGSAYFEGVRNGSSRLLLRDVDLNLYVRPAEIGPDASFVLRDVPPGRYRVTVEPRPWHVRAMRLGASQIDGAVLELSGAPPDAGLEVVVSSATGELAGTVRNGDAAAPGASVVLWRRDAYGRSLMGYATADAGSSYAIKGIAPGTYRLIAVRQSEVNALFASETTAEYEELMETVEIRAGDRTTRDLEARAR